MWPHSPLMNSRKAVLINDHLLSISQEPGRVLVALPALMLTELPNSLTTLSNCAFQIRKVRLKKVEEPSAGISAGCVLSTPPHQEALAVCVPVYNLAQFPAYALEPFPLPPSCLLTRLWADHGAKSLWMLVTRA